MALYTTLASLSQTAASNAANGASDSPSTIDEQMNLLASFVAMVRDGNGLTFVIGDRNKIHNAGFQVNQRGVTGTVTLAAGAYGHDRWKAGASGCTYTFGVVGADTVLTITAGSLQQVIEGDSLESSSVVMTWTGTAQGKIGAGAYAASGVTGTATPGSNLTVEFNTGTLSKVQLEAGTYPTPHARRSRGRELNECLRFFYRIPFTVRAQGYAATGGANTYQTINFPTLMRAIPTATATFSAGVNNAAQTIANLDTGGGQVMLTASGAGDYAVSYAAGNSFSADL
jgi:hypothetical protein